MSPNKVALVSADNERTQTQLAEFQRLCALIGPEAEVVWVDSEQPADDLVAELEGTVTKLSHEELVAQIDALTAAQEARFEKAPWSRTKMTDGLFEKMLGGITGFALEPKVWRGTQKLSQNKSTKAQKKASAEVETHGRPAIAHWMRSLES